VIAATLLLAVTAFTPPRLISGPPPALPPPTVVAGGEVIIEATVEKDGSLTHPVVLRSTPPYTQMVLDAIGGWHFRPARVPDANGNDQTVASKVLIAAVYRAPALFNGPMAGSPPVDVVRPSGEAPYPVAMTQPAYPPQARTGGVVVMEVSLDEAGTPKIVRTVRSDPGFESAARDALSRWQFRGASLRSKPVPSTAYVIFGFVSPIVNGPANQTPPPK
jgi:TonB family protein